MPPPPPAGQQSPTDMWNGVVLPAVTWLYGWVEWELNGSHAPSIVEREHRAAFSHAISRVTEAMRAQNDPLATAIWRSMVAVLTHVRTHTLLARRSHAPVDKTALAAAN
jgi:hypothetical protein